MKKKYNQRALYRPSLPFLIILFTIYMGIVIYVTFFMWNYGSSFGPQGPGGRNYNLEPFLSIYRIYHYSPDAVAFRILGGNILLFVPFGILFPLIIERILSGRWFIVSIMTIVSAVTFSIIIEINQFIFTHRVANIDDLILNTLGGIVGLFIYRLARLIRFIN